MIESTNEKILKLLEEKILLKKDVFDKANSAFVELKKIVSQLVMDLNAKGSGNPKYPLADYKETNENEFLISLADETLVFVLHSNIFTFDQTHEIWKNSYVEKDHSRSYCGKIFIYNFLSDSFHYNRTNDIGYLIARIFINKDSHFFVEGKKQLGYLYNDFSTMVLNKENIEKILEAAILFSLDFDPFTPPFDAQIEISVKEVMEASVQARIATGKRLGFEFSGDDKPVVG